jgi:hypothetical protein
LECRIWRSTGNFALAFHIYIHNHIIIKTVATFCFGDQLSGTVKSISPPYFSKRLLPEIADVFKLLEARINIAAWRNSNDLMACETMQAVKTALVF